MLLFFFIVLDPILSVVALAPLIVWRHGSPRYHPYIIAAALFLLLTLGPPAAWRAWRNWREATDRTPPEHAAWKPGTSPEAFAPRLKLFLFTIGWRVQSASPTSAGNVLVRATKDRDAVTLLFLAPATRVDRAHLRDLPPGAIIVMRKKPAPEDRALAAQANCTILDAETFGKGGAVSF